MKIIRLKLLLVLLALPASVLAGEPGFNGKYTKEKRINKAYYVNSNAALDVSNKFGMVYVTTWDEDKTDIEVVIKVSADSEELVNKRLSTIDVDITALKSLVTARTKIGSFSGKRIEMEINYTIKIPKNGPIKIHNQYGDIKTGKIYGKSELKCEYGGLNIEELNNESNSITIEYSGTSRLNYMRNGSLVAKYSEFKMTRGKSLNARCEYSQFKVGELDDLTLHSEYGDVAIEKVGHITGTTAYGQTRIGNVSSLCNITSEYGDVKVNNISQGAKNVAINSSYGTVNLKYDENLSFDFEFTTEYSNVNGMGAFKVTDRREKNNGVWYKGYYKSSGNARIFVKNEYGDINLSRS